MAKTLADAGKGGNSTPAPSGNHIGLCIGVVFLGTHTEDGQFGVKTNEKLRLSWELPEETKIFKEENGPEPFVVSQTYNFFMSDKARLRKDLEAWRNKEFSPEEIASFTLDKLLGQPCMVQVSHAVKGGKTYSNVDAITAIPKSVREHVPKPHNKLVYYDLELGKGETFQSLPKFLQDIINKCNEWNAPEESQAPAEETNPDREPPEDLEVALGPKTPIATEDMSEVPF